MTSAYSKLEINPSIPRLPLQGGIDLTYRCNNNCRHCWLRIPSGDPKGQTELRTDEIKALVDEAREMGCRRWSISGGEPMLRPDFAEIFDYITSHSVSYSLNTNGTLITPEIADLMKRKGSKMVALYGATAEVHDHITRNPGSFLATMRGFDILREAGVGFTVQLIPMRDNYHQFAEMVRLAKSLSSHWRVGAAWLFLSSSGDPAKNAEIDQQRLSPKEVIELDKPDLSGEKREAAEMDHAFCRSGDDRLFAKCIEGRRDFHVDPYGQMTFCSFIKDPEMRYNLRKGTFWEAWEEFIPSLKDKVQGKREYLENCDSCELRSDCRWCPVYGYLEHGRHEAKVEYLCDVAKACRDFKDDWKSKHRRFYQIAGINIQVDSDLPFSPECFNEKFASFQVRGSGEDNVILRHHFSLPDIREKDLGQEIYRKPPWAIYKKNGSWIYLGISPREEDRSLHRVVVFNHDHSRGQIYNDGEETFRKGDLQSLTLFPSDQIMLAPLLADRQACFLHSAGAIMNGQGLLFIGHSSAGKSTTIKMIRDKAQILCDDRNIVRLWPEGFRVHGTWSHGEIGEVSSASVPLRALIFLKKSNRNRLNPISDRREIAKRTLPCVIKSLETPQWWQKTLTVVEALERFIPAYEMEFDKSGEIVESLVALSKADAA
jgi:radical SAM protein with 4Fe4S-binding SPASM domain